ncbi:hypothetical protein AM1_0078 [Acaryochloris marina MBIC11017]|uniref:Uncharacterized protein n=1 Tax=Acaryochloris marina (strain MBIC 11017) TaxID=329726 RepID=B0C554_ACAM1|nr:hypothetical protein AM1_0078 [Acaryochloris marina MBIC11017]
MGNVDHSNFFRCIKARQQIDFSCIGPTQAEGRINRAFAWVLVCLVLFS